MVYNRGLSVGNNTGPSRSQESRKAGKCSGSLRKCR